MLEIPSVRFIYDIFTSKNIYKGLCDTNIVGRKDKKRRMNILIADMYRNNEHSLNNKMSFPWALTTIIACYCHRLILKCWSSGIVSNNQRQMTLQRGKYTKINFAKKENTFRVIWMAQHANLEQARLKFSYVTIEIPKLSLNYFSIN